MLYNYNMDTIEINETKEGKVKANMTVTLNKDETKVQITLTFTGPGWDNHNMVDAEAAKFVDAKEIGMVYKQGRYTAEVDATETACAPFIAFAEKHGLEIIQL
jgi:hypothetical protein